VKDEIIDRYVMTMTIWKFHLALPRLVPAFFALSSSPDNLFQENVSRNLFQEIVSRKCRSVTDLATVLALKSAEEWELEWVTDLATGSAVFRVPDIQFTRELFQRVPAVKIYPDGRGMSLFRLS
jgi:hypothetical protein